MLTIHGQEFGSTSAPLNILCPRLVLKPFSISVHVISPCGIMSLNGSKVNGEVVVTVVSKAFVVVGCSVVVVVVEVVVVVVELVVVVICAPKQLPFAKSEGAQF